MIAVTYKNRCRVEPLSARVKDTLNALSVPSQFRLEGQKQLRSAWDAYHWSDLKLPPTVTLAPLKPTILFEIHFSDGTIIMLNLCMSTTAQSFKRIVAVLKYLDCELFFLDGTQWKDSLWGHDADEKPPCILVNLRPFTAVVIFGKSCQVTLDQTVGDVCDLTNEFILYQNAQRLRRSTVLSSLPHLTFERHG